jgi:hypothetical protein
MPDIGFKDWSPRQFFELAETLGQRWAEALPFFSVAVAKWRYEDLVPGLSDLDPRVLCQDIGADDWLELDRVSGRIQLDLLWQRPEWSRKLEHTPGVCMNLSELYDPLLYQPEMRQWSYYYGDRAIYNQLKTHLRERAWDVRDERFHLARWLMFWGPYNREIDPPINVAPAIEPRYALHSRAMHYFVPALQAALSILDREAVGGKRETLYRWLDRFPDEPVLGETAHMLEVHYEVPILYDLEALYAFEARCFDFLLKIAPMVLNAVTSVPLPENATADDLQIIFQQQPPDPLQAMFTGVKFARIRTGRWQMYLNAPPYYDTDWLLGNEIRQVGAYFTHPYFAGLTYLRWGETALPLEEIVARLRGELLDAAETEAVLRIFELAHSEPDHVSARDRVAQAMAIFPTYYCVLEKLFADTLARQRALRPEGAADGGC